MMASKSFKIPAVTLIWTGTPEEPSAVFRDKQLRLIEPLTDFCDFQISKHRRQGMSEQAIASLVQGIVYSVKDYAEFLAVKKVGWKYEVSKFDIKLVASPITLVNQLDKPVRHWLDANNNFLKGYRTWSFDRICANSRSRGFKRKAKRTFNRKLQWVYELYCWAQMDAKIAVNLMSWGDDTSNIRSSLPEIRTSAAAEYHKLSHKCPLMFTNIGEGSRANEGQHWASSNDVALIERHFEERYQQLLAERNKLLLHIAEHMGWRCGSVASLTIDLFSRDEIDKQFATGRDSFLVTPPVQKNYHQFSFPVPWPLAFRIRNYIDGGRATLLEASKGKEADAGSALFVTTRGEGLSSKTICRIFGHAFKSIGAPKGAAYHALRRGMLDELIDRTMQSRHEVGASTAMEDVLQDARDAAGQVSGNAIEAYVRASRRRKRRSVVDTQHQEIVSLECERERAAMENAVLRDVITRRL